MSVRDIRLLHRIAVDWTADTFGLRDRPAGRARNEAAAFRAGRRHARTGSGGQARAVNAAAAVRAAERHARREPRVLRGWQNWIAGAGRGSGSRP
jgi:hypothetical protein